MASNRRIGKESSETRKLLLHAAEQLMREEGYARVTSRKLAQKAGLKPQLVHYYFRTMSELFDAVFQQSTARYVALLDEVAHSEDPIARMFELSCDSSSAALQLEFLALSNHRKDMHTLIANFGRELNRREADIVRRSLTAESATWLDATPEEIAMIIQTVARGLSFAGKFDEERFTKARGTVIKWLRLLSESRKPT